MQSAVRLLSPQGRRATHARTLLTLDGACSTRCASWSYRDFSPPTLTSVYRSRALTCVVLLTIDADTEDGRWRRVLCSERTCAQASSIVIYHLVLGI